MRCGENGRYWAEGDTTQLPFQKDSPGCTVGRGRGQAGRWALVCRGRSMRSGGGVTGFRYKCMKGRKSQRWCSVTPEEFNLSKRKSAFAISGAGKSVGGQVSENSAFPFGHAWIGVSYCWKISVWTCQEAVTQIHLEFGRENWFVKMWEKHCAGDTEVRLVSAYSLARRQCFPHHFPIHASLLELTSS